MNVKPSLLYVGAGSIEAVKTGLDSVIKTHTDALSAGDIETVAIIVSPSIEAYKSWREGRCTFHVYPSVVHCRRTPLLWEKLRVVLLSMSTLRATSLYSPKAAKEIRRWLKSDGIKAVLVDMSYTMVNLPRSVFAPRHKLIFIAHDILSTYHSVPTGRGAIARMIMRWMHRKATKLERRLIKRARRTVFLSEHDRRTYPEAESHTLSLLPFADALLDRPVAEEGGLERTILFIGSPGYPPNAHALDWIAAKLSPALQAIDPTLKIALVGKGTEAVATRGGNNLEGLGFISEERMHHLLRHSIGLVCPIVHGGGIKIKVLDAIMANCPVIATAESLYGYESFDIAPMIVMDDPVGTAHAIVRLADRPEERTKLKQQLRARLEAYGIYKKDRLIQTIKEVIAEA